MGRMMVRSAISASVCALCLFTVLYGSPASAHGGARRPLRDMIGLVVKWHQDQPQSDLPMLLDLRVRWVRDTIEWRDVEPSARHYVDFPLPLRQRLDFYRAHDIGVVFFLGYANALAYPPRPERPDLPIDPVAIGNYAVEVARKLKAAGVRFAIEVWNEPHNGQIAEIKGGAWNGAPPSPWVRHYVSMVREVVARVKAFDRGIEVLSDDDMWILHYRFLEAGLPRELDGFAFHPYTPGEPEVATVRQHTDWMQPFIAVDADASFRSAVRRLRDRGLEKLGHLPKMWITEWGWPAELPAPGAAQNDEARVATFLARSFLSADAAQIDVMCWFSSFDGPDGPMGLLAHGGRKRLAYYALKTLSEQLGDYSLARWLVGSETPTKGVQALLYRRDRDQRLAIWSIDAPESRLRLRGPLRDATAIDTLGELVSMREDEDGVPTLPIGRSPIYISGLREGELRLEFQSTPNKSRPSSSATRGLTPPALNPEAGREAAH